MRALLMTLILMGLSLRSADALQTCPAGNPRIAPDSRYTDHGNGTLTDSQTGLMWKQCSEGQSGATCSGVPVALTWGNALSAASNSSFAGFNDWRLPDVKELRSIVDTRREHPAIDAAAFPSHQQAIDTYYRLLFEHESARRRKEEVSQP